MGRASLGEDTWSPNRSEFHVEMKPGTPGEEQEHVTKEIRELLEKTPGIQSEVLTFLGDRIGETISGETAPVVVSMMFGMPASMPLRVRPLVSFAVALSRWCAVWRNTHAMGRSEANR